MGIAWTAAGHAISAASHTRPESKTSSRSVHIDSLKHTMSAQSYHDPNDSATSSTAPGTQTGNSNSQFTLNILPSRPSATYRSALSRRSSSGSQPGVPLLQLRTDGRLGDPSQSTIHDAASVHYPPAGDAETERSFSNRIGESTSIAATNAVSGLQSPPAIAKVACQSISFKLSAAGTSIKVSAVSSKDTLISAYRFLKNEQGPINFAAELDPVVVAVRKLGESAGGRRPCLALLIICAHKENVGIKAGAILQRPAFLRSAKVLDPVNNVLAQGWHKRDRATQADKDGDRFTEVPSNLHKMITIPHPNGTKLLSDRSDDWLCTIRWGTWDQAHRDSRGCCGGDSTNSRNALLHFRMDVSCGASLKANLKRGLKDEEVQSIPTEMMGWSMEERGAWWLLDGIAKS